MQYTESKIIAIVLCAPGFRGAAEENLVVREKQQPSAATTTVEDSNVCETLVAAVALTELNHSALKSLKKYILGNILGKQYCFPQRLKSTYWSTRAAPEGVCTVKKF